MIIRLSHTPTQKKRTEARLFSHKYGLESLYSELPDHLEAMLPYGNLYVPEILKHLRHAMGAGQSMSQHSDNPRRFHEEWKKTWQSHSMLMHRGWFRNRLGDMTPISSPG